MYDIYVSFSYMYQVTAGVFIAKYRLMSVIGKPVQKYMLHSLEPVFYITYIIFSEFYVKMTMFTVIILYFAWNA